MCSVCATCSCDTPPPLYVHCNKSPWPWCLATRALSLSLSGLAGWLPASKHRHSWSKGISSKATFSYTATVGPPYPPCDIFTVVLAAVFFTSPLACCWDAYMSWYLLLPLWYLLAAFHAGTTATGAAAARPPPTLDIFPTWPIRPLAPPHHHTPKVKRKKRHMIHPSFTNSFCALRSYC